LATETATPVLVPLLNPNEPEARVVSVEVRDGQSVKQGDLLCTLETTKSTADVVAEVAGYVISLQIRENQLISAGETLCFLADSPDWKPAAPGPQPKIESARPGDEIPEGLRITEPALLLARQLDLDLTTLPLGPLITEKTIRARTPRSDQAIQLAGEYDANAILIYGGGGHAKTLIELIRLLAQHRVVGILDDGLLPGGTVMGLPLLGGGEILPELFDRGVHLAANAVGGIGNIQVRIRIFDRLTQAGFQCPAFTHPSAYVEPSAAISAGCQVLSLAYVGSEAQIGFGVIVNTAAVVSHDCILEDYANVSPGALIAGAVRIGRGVLIGMGATINLGVRVGDNARIGNGATVKEDVPENAVVRAGAIWP
jgi:sugar O-acyltransferase (sialic acid O-acetyltransferase NeuD family)